MLGGIRGQVVVKCARGEDVIKCASREFRRRLSHQSMMHLHRRDTKGGEREMSCLYFAEFTDFARSIVALFRMLVLAQQKLAY